jgi:hypothetical protein
MRLINNHRQPLTLDGGVILAAAGTPGSEKEVESISDRDRRRYVASGRIAIVVVEDAPVTTRKKASDRVEDK